MIKKSTGFLRKITLFFRKPLPKKIVHIATLVLKYLFFVFVIFILYLPIIIIAIQSVNQSENMYDFTNFSLKWYVELMDELSLFDPGILGAAIQRTLLVAFISTAISTVLGTIFAIGIHSLAKKAKQRMVFLNQVPILNADIVTGISLMLIFRLFMMIFPSIFGFPTLLLAHIFFSLPYVVLSVLPKLSELDENLYDAALDLGCKPFSGMVKVIIPAISSGIFTGMLIAFTMSIDDFVISYFTTGNGFDNVSIWVYASIGRRMTPAVYAYNTLLSMTVVVGLIVIYIFSVIKKKRNTNLKNRTIKGAV
ncbi:MAG: ABC transporter permease [Candidatus Izemoplasmatales bacterium]|jgi:spermidine/putrescine transport system permease protein|nr:ABC transporter permease [Candidatus Izemoplasmatales bacterium]